MELTRTPDGLRWVVDRDVDASADDVWDVLTDTIRWPDWAPIVAEVESSTRHVEPGTTGTVRFRGTAVPVPFEVLTVDESRRRWTWDVGKLVASGHHVDERPGGSRVAFELPLAIAGYAPVVRRSCSNIAKIAESRAARP